MTVPQFHIGVLQMATYIDVRLCFPTSFPQNKNKWLNCLFKYSASATLQVYALNSAIEQLCCPSVNISHLFGKAVTWRWCSGAERNATSGVSWLSVQYAENIARLPQCKANVNLFRYIIIVNHFCSATSFKTSHVLSEYLFLSHIGNNKCADQPAHLYSLISVFCCSLAR